MNAVFEQYNAHFATQTTPQEIIPPTGTGIIFITICALMLVIFAAYRYKR